ncbi:MAG: ABC transporter substrate-binding protein [Candidatus Sericytochromatia bacterium]
MKLRSQTMLVMALILGLIAALNLPGTAAEDYFKRPLKWPAIPHRILSLSPATTEMVYAVGAGKQLVGVSNDCNYPAEAAKKTKVGPFGKLQLESIVKLKPDLIVATADMGQALEPLRRLAIPVIAFKTPNVAAIENNLLELGKLTGHLPTAQKQVDGLKARLTHVQANKLKAPSVFYLVWDQPLVTATPGSFIGNVLTLSGAKNVVAAGKAPFINYSLESLLKANPDVLILPKSVAGRLKLDKPPFSRLKASQAKHIMTIEDDLISRPGPRVIQAIEKINAYLRGLHS